MYRYDDFDRAFVNERVDHYRQQTERYLAGNLSEDEFLQLRLRNGLYVQRLAPMLRVAVPYGTLSSQQLRALAKIAREYDRGYGHLSTRQNMQFNWPELAEVPDILADLAAVDMHAIQTSGNCIRNVTTDEFAGAAHDEEIDPRPYCELIRQWSTNHPEFDWLPRKFKIAVNGAREDRAAIAVHDIGLRIHTDGGQDSVDFYVGGGLGRTPVVAPLIKANLPIEHVLTYLEAVMRVYNRYGRRDNKYKARIKILVRALSPEKFAEQVEAEWQHLKDGPSTVTTAEIDRLKGHFLGPNFASLSDARDQLAEQRLSDPAFSAWLNNNVVAHKMEGYSAVTLSAKVTGIPPGDVSDEQMDIVADLADRYSFGEIRISHQQNFVLPHVPQKALKKVHAAAVAAGLGEANVGLATDMICCPGGDYCSLANAKSIPVAEAIARQYDDQDFLHDLGPIDINISGCMNACGHHHVGHIGILGVDKKGDEFYQISVGGHSGHGETDASLGQILGPSFARAEVTDVIGQLFEVYREVRLGEDESFLACYRRVGIDPFKEKVYAPA